MHRLANPTRFLRIANALLPWLAAAAVLLLATGLWLALFRSPADYQQGETVRIMYVHVPAAWLAMAGYSALALASAAFLVRSEEHTVELQSLMPISLAVFFLNNK